MESERLNEADLYERMEEDPRGADYDPRGAGVDTRGVSGNQVFFSDFMIGFLTLGAFFFWWLP
jgi:hypothetical protein